MKAVVNFKYGTPEVLEIREVKKPSPGNNDVLIKIHATTVNRTDCGFRKPEYLIVRFFGGFFSPRKNILGNELSGVIEETGKNVTRFNTGDQVFGLSTSEFGTHAEYICLPENDSIAIKPSNMTFEEAAAVCDGLMLAINILRKIDFNTAKNILINGASGSIGSACVQLAHYFGANVTAVCNTKNLDLVKSLGASETIDYTREDFTQQKNDFDVIIDAVGKSSFFKCRHLLNKKGLYFSTELGYMSQNILLAILTPLFNREQVKFPIPSDSQQDIEFFKQLIEAGHYKAVIDRIYKFDQIIEATRYVETGEKTGNVVIRLI